MDVGVEMTNLICVRTENHRLFNFWPKWERNMFFVLYKSSMAFKGQIHFLAVELKDEVKVLSSSKRKQPPCPISQCWVRHRLVTSVGHQEGRRISWEGPKFFELCPTHFSRGANMFLGGFSPLLPSGYGPGSSWYLIIWHMYSAASTKWNSLCKAVMWQVAKFKTSLAGYVLEWESGRHELKKMTNFWY